MVVQGGIDKARDFSELYPKCVERTRLDGPPFVAGASAGRAPRPLASDHRQLVGVLLHRTMTHVRADAHQGDGPSVLFTALGRAFRHERTDISQDAREC